MASPSAISHRPIKDLPRAFGVKRNGQAGKSLYARSEPHSRTPSRDTGSRTTEGDSTSFPATSNPGSTNSTSAPSSPPQSAVDALPSAPAKDAASVAAADGEADSTTFRFTNLPRIGRSDLLMDPLAAARVVLNYSTRAQQALSQQCDELSTTTTDLQTQTSTLIGGMASLTALYNNAIRSKGILSPVDAQGTGSMSLSASTAPAQAQNAFSVARMQAQQDDDECGPELTVYEHSVNKKKRKSGRVTYMDSSGAADGYRGTGGKGDCSWYCGDDADYPQDDDPNRDYNNGASEEQAPEQEAPPPPPRMFHPPPHLSFSARQLLRTKEKVSAKSRFQRFQRREKANAAALEASQANAQGLANGEQGKDVKQDAAAEKKPPRRATKAESRAKVRGGGTQKISLAALKAKLAEEQQNASGSDAGVGGGGSKPGPGKAIGKGAVEKTPRPSSPSAAADTSVQPAPPPPKEPIKPPTGVFSFSRPSPIASRLIAMRAEVEMLQSKLSDSLRPIDEAVAAAADVLTRMDAGEDVANAHAEAAAALSAARSNLEAIPAPSLALGSGTALGARAPIKPAQAQTAQAPPTSLPALPEAPRYNAPAAVPPLVTAPLPPLPPPPIAHEPAPVAIAATTTAPPAAAPAASVAPPVPTAPAATTPTPPPQAPKISRRKKANMNNIHHRTNYVPSRMPSDPPPSARGPSKNVSTVQNWEQAPGLDHPTTTCSLFANEWLCLFCEYELLYGELPSMVRACRRRKKVVGARKRAQDRAHRAAGGEVAEGLDGETGSQTTAGAPGTAAAGAGEKKKKKGKKKDRALAGGDHGHECCTCTCGKENPAEWEPDAPFANNHHHAPAPASASASAPAAAAAAAVAPPVNAKAPPSGANGQQVEDAYEHGHDEENCETCRAGYVVDAAAVPGLASGAPQS
ncbi:hypothetical protein OC844_005116 [Tilletia horrida]|nr:hypothetical protein OC844_005116 [Tilletia horrida]